MRYFTHNGLSFFTVTMKETKAGIKKRKNRLWWASIRHPLYSMFSRTRANTAATSSVFAAIALQTLTSSTA